MSDSIALRTAAPALRPATGAGHVALRRSAAVWLLAAIAGQWAFFAYIAAFYGASTFTGEFEVWNRLAVLGRSPYVAGDTAGNLAYAAHALGAGIVSLGGALQLLPRIRARWPAFHRWNGRVFLVTVLGLAFSGYYLVWVRGTSPSLTDAFSTTVNGVLIVAFVWLAYRAVRARDIATHRRWAIRLYLVSNAQWFLRVGLFAYFIVSRIAGIKVGIGDPFLHFWTFGCYLVPLAVAELYFRAQESASPALRRGVALGLVAATLLMVVGMLGFGAFSYAIVSGGALKLG